MTVVDCSPDDTNASSVSQQQPQQQRQRQQHHSSSSEMASTSADNRQHQDPEALVRVETRVIDCLRCLVIGLLMVVATAMSVATFKLSRRWEVESFHNDFHGIATRMTQIFLDQTSTKLWYANVVSVTITDLAANSFPNTSVRALHNLAPGFATIANVERAFWAPYIHNRTERIAWEAYAKESTETSQQSVCYVCGEPNKAVSLPDLVARLPGIIRPYTCGEVEQGGLHGIVPTTACRLVQSYVTAQCGCEDVNVTNNGYYPLSYRTPTQVFRLQNETRVPVTDSGPSFPVWQSFGANEVLMYDQFSNPIRKKSLQSMLKSGLPTFSLTSATDDEFRGLLPDKSDTPVATLFYPVFRLPNNRDAVGSISTDFYWKDFFYSLIPINSDGLVVVFSNSQGQAFTFQVEGDHLSFLGRGDLHDPSFDEFFRQTSFEDFQKRVTAFTVTDSNTMAGLRYQVRIYPSTAFKARYVTSKPAIYTVIVALIFVFTSTIFMIYDYLVRKRQEKVMLSAMRDDAIVSSLFPANIRDRLFASILRTSQSSSRRLVPSPAPRAQLQNLLSLSSPEIDMASLDLDADPIADLFPRCSVIFADISGFTAWSSEREPAQVFRLLETVYRAFDQLAKAHGVFKIETVGDCYVAATGVPEAQDDHAIRIIRFAHACLARMKELTRSLEALLGPGTADLSIRIGIHSGSVTGGVLRGDKARFQLFGDTMNTAARMESTGDTDRIQISPATAELMGQCGAADWLTPRVGGVFVKGKGDMQTFWVLPEERCQCRSRIGSYESTDIIMLHPSSEEESVNWGFANLESPLSSMEGLAMAACDKEQRLVDWISDLLYRLTQRIVARRNAASRNARFTLSTKRSTKVCGRERVNSLNVVEDTANHCGQSNTPLEDVTEVLSMPDFCMKMEQCHQDSDTMVLGERVRSQLREYVLCVASLYHDNPFHNFEHASHVAMSAWKIMNRIIKPQNANYYSNPSAKSRHSIRKQSMALAEEIHRTTFGISSDPLMQFAVVFCALIHDADHQGVTNAQLVQERDGNAIKYNAMCVAEQNSVHLCWMLLLEDRFADFRSCVCATDDEITRFRQLVVNAVIATDIADRELQQSRKQRWDRAFAQPVSETDATDRDMVMRRATVVFEYIIQASDVAHTMQHWCIYSKWNDRLFEERYKAHVAGREPNDPSMGWYEGELGFFDNYIIPLANKLEHCGVFGVSSDEYLNYALENRREWEMKGKAIVETFQAKYCGRVPNFKSVDAKHCAAAD